MAWLTRDWKVSDRYARAAVAPLGLSTNTGGAVGSSSSSR